MSFRQPSLEAWDVVTCKVHGKQIPMCTIDILICYILLVQQLPKNISHPPLEKHGVFQSDPFTACTECYGEIKQTELKTPLVQPANYL